MHTHVDDAWMRFKGLNQKPSVNARELHRPAHKQLLHEKRLCAGCCTSSIFCNSAIQVTRRSKKMFEISTAREGITEDSVMLRASERIHGSLSRAPWRRPDTFRGVSRWTAALTVATENAVPRALRARLLRILRSRAHQSSLTLMWGRLRLVAMGLQPEHRLIRCELINTVHAAIERRRDATDLLLHVLHTREGDGSLLLQPCHHPAR